MFPLEFLAHSLPPSSITYIAGAEKHSIPFLSQPQNSLKFSETTQIEILSFLDPTNDCSLQQCVSSKNAVSESASELLPPIFSLVPFNQKWQDKALSKWGS